MTFRVTAGYSDYDPSPAHDIQAETAGEALRALTKLWERYETVEPLSVEVRIAGRLLVYKISFEEKG